MPLAILIHGLGDRPRRDWLPSAANIETPVRLIMPQAPTPYYDGFAWFPYRIRGNDPVALARGIAGRSRTIWRARSPSLRLDRPTVGRPFVMGFSQGGMLSYQLALHHPEVVELSLPMSGMLPESLWPAAKPAGTRFPRIVALHGDADEIVPIAPARALVARLRTLGYDSGAARVPGVEHHITPAMEASQSSCSRPTPQRRLTEPDARHGSQLLPSARRSSSRTRRSTSMKRWPSACTKARSHSVRSSSRSSAARVTRTSSTSVSGRHARGARRGAEDRRLAEHLARAERAHGALLAVDLAEQLALALDHDVGRVGLIAFAQHERVLGQAHASRTSRRRAGSAAPGA